VSAFSILCRRKRTYYFYRRNEDYQTALVVVKYITWNSVSRCGKLSGTENMSEPKPIEAEKRGGSCAPAAGSASGSYITFEPLAPNPATKRWAVMSKDQGSQIGSVSWYGPWRKYCFMPMASTVFEQVCLREIAEFIERETKSHRASKNAIVEGLVTR
jgi:hypothetical protein